MPSWELMQQVGRIMRRAANSLPHESDWPLLSLQILGVPEVANGLKASTIVDELKRRHRPVAIPDRWATGITDIHVCNACRSAWPCDDITILQGASHDGTEGAHRTEEAAAAPAQ